MAAAFADEGAANHGRLVTEHGATGIHLFVYGREADEKALEAIFMTSYYKQTPPVWVRHLAREVLRRAEGGRLDPTEYGLPRPRPSEGMSLAELERWSLLIYVAALAAVFFVLPALR